MATTESLRDCVLRVDRKALVGKRNHRVCAALLLGWETMRVRLLEALEND